MGISAPLSEDRKSLFQLLMSALLITSDDVMATNVEVFQRIANFLCVFFNQKSFGQVLTLTQKLTRFLSTARPIATPPIMEQLETQ